MNKAEAMISHAALTSSTIFKRLVIGSIDEAGCKERDDSCQFNSTEQSWIIKAYKVLHSRVLGACWGKNTKSQQGKPGGNLLAQQSQMILNSY